MKEIIAIIRADLVDSTMGALVVSCVKGIAFSRVLGRGGREE